LDILARDKLGIKTVILCGDIFDFLSCSVDYSIEYNKKVIDRLNTLSKELHIIYLEGNHDFNLKELFKNLDIIPREKQPIQISVGNSVGLVSHGDLNLGYKYEFFTKVIRSHHLLKLLTFFDKIFLNKKIVKYLYWYLPQKRICRKRKGTVALFQKRVESFKNSFKFDFIIEGHFHQGDFIEIDRIKYLNLPSFACEKSFFIIKSKKNGFLLSKVNARSFDVS
jgi:UDP-2,3-diacylglucosamine hydrolase